MSIQLWHFARMSHLKCGIQNELIILLKKHRSQRHKGCSLLRCLAMSTKRKKALKTYLKKWKRKSCFSEWHFRACSHKKSGYALEPRIKIQRKLQKFRSWKYQWRVQVDEGKDYCTQRPLFLICEYAPLLLYMKLTKTAARQLRQWRSVAYEAGGRPLPRLEKFMTNSVFRASAKFLKNPER